MLNINYKLKYEVLLPNRKLASLCAIARDPTLKTCFSAICLTFSRYRIADLNWLQIADCRLEMAKQGEDTCYPASVK